MLDGEKVRAEIAAFLKRQADQVGDDQLLTSLVAESFILVELVIDLQEAFSVRIDQDDFAGVKTVGDLIAVFKNVSKT